MDRNVYAALKSEYEAGVASLAVLAKKYDMTPAKISNLAKREGWVRLMPPSEEKVMNTVRLFSLDPLEEQAMSSAMVVSIHRRDVARLRTIANTLVERLGLEMAGELPDQTICRGSKESPADLLEKLSRVLVRTTEIERQAYGLKSFDPESAATDAAVQTQLDELEKQLETIAHEKADTR